MQQLVRLILLGIVVLLANTSVLAHVHAPIDIGKIESLMNYPLSASAPQQVHLAFGADVSEYVVSWVSFDFDTTQKSIVEYGPAPFQWQKVVTAVPFVFVEDRCGTKRMMHNVPVPGLTPGQVVYYHVSSDSQNWSEVFHFTVADRNNRKKPLTVSLVGDMTVYPVSQNSSIPQWALDTHNNVHDFVMHYGDIAYNLDNNCNLIGDYFMQQAESVAAYTAYLVGPGNHETDENYTYATYLNRYAGQHRMAAASGSDVVRWFSFNAQLVHFIFFDTDAWIYPEVFPLAKLQLEWMRADLAKVDRTKTPWIIVLGHRSMYCTKNTDPECNGEAEAIRNGVYINSTVNFGGVEPLLLEFGVDLYFGGHTHHYMRTWPVKRAQLIQTNYVNPQAPIHVQAGMGGVDGNDPFSLPMKPYDAWRDMTYRNGFSRLVIHNATHLSFTQRAAWDGSVFDSFELQQTTHGAFS